MASEQSRMSKPGPFTNLPHRECFEDIMGKAMCAALSFLEKWENRSIKHSLDAVGKQCSHMMFPGMGICVITT